MDLLSSNKKRERGKNFTDKEKEILEKIISIENYRNILENRKTDHKTTQLKNRVWFEITDIFNAQTGSDRPINQLKNYYKSRRRLSHVNLQELLSEEDRDILLELIKENVDVIENNSPELKELKKDTWHSITSSYNSKAQIKRNTLFLKYFYINYKFRANEGNIAENDTDKYNGDENYFENSNDQCEECNPSIKLENLSNSPDDASTSHNDIANDSENEDGNLESRPILLQNAKESYLIHYYILKAKLLEDERRYKRIEFENQQKEFEHKIEMINIDKRIKEQELKLKEIETEIKLEELKKIQNGDS